VGSSFDILPVLVGFLAGLTLGVGLLLRSFGRALRVLSERVERLETEARPSIHPLAEPPAEMIPTTVQGAPLDPWPQTLRGHDPPLVAPPIPGLTPEEESRAELAKRDYVRGAEDTLPPALRVTQEVLRSPKPLPPSAETSLPDLEGTRFFPRPVQVSPAREPPRHQAPQWAWRTASDHGVVGVPRAPAEPVPPVTSSSADDE